jgi:hypothetical protein
MYPSEVYPMSTGLTVELNTRRVVAAIATFAGLVLVLIFGAAIGSEAQAKSRPCADDLTQPPSHSHISAAE